MQQGFHQRRSPGGYNVHRRSFTRQEHPVLVPVALLLASLVLILAGFFSDILFPALNAFGLPSVALCLSLAWILGTCGALSGIIGIIERIDQWSCQAAAFSHTQEQSYANRN